MAGKPVMHVRWTDPAVVDLEVIADYVAVDNPRAAAALVQKVYSAVGRLVEFPRMGRRVPELPGLPYRELIIAPCRVLYRIEGGEIFVVLVIRSEMLLEEHRLWR